MSAQIECTCHHPKELHSPSGRHRCTRCRCHVYYPRLVERERLKAGRRERTPHVQARVDGPAAAAPLPRATLGACRVGAGRRMSGRDRPAPPLPLRDPGPLAPKLKRYSIVYTERFKVVIEAESESAARQAWIDGCYDGAAILESHLERVRLGALRPKDLEPKGCRACKAREKRSREWQKDDRCGGCGRESLACSEDPCADVIHDRGECDDGCSICAGEE